MFPSLQLLEKVSKKIMSVPNRRKESKRRVHHGLFLLGYKSGLRVNEAVSFDLANKEKRGLYRIERPKGKKERFVYIPKKVIRELKENNWKPNQTNRWNFYHFLRKIKRELNISKEIELTPHTLWRAFATYQAESGLPLPLLQKLLGHSSIRTTALYWQNTHGNGDNDNMTDILAGKKWLEDRKEPPKPPITENFPAIAKSPKPIFIDQKPLIPNKKPIQQGNYLLTTKLTEKSRELINKISPKPPEKFFSLQENSFNERKFFLDNTRKKSNQIETNQQLASIPNKSERANEKEQILLEKIKSLEEQLKQVQEENKNLTIKLAESEKEKNQERERADNYQQQLKTIAKAFSQWQKISYYQQLEKERRELEAKVEQPPPLRDNK